jgi:hypothetical protein
MGNQLISVTPLFFCSPVLVTPYFLITLIRKVGPPEMPQERCWESLVYVIHAVRVSPSSVSQNCLSQLRSFQLYMFYMYICSHVSVFCNRSLFLNISLSGISQDNDVLRRESEGTRARALLCLSSLLWIVQPLST